MENKKSLSKKAFIIVFAVSAAVLVAVGVIVDACLIWNNYSGNSRVLLGVPPAMAGSNGYISGFLYSMQVPSKLEEKLAPSVYILPLFSAGGTQAMYDKYHEILFDNYLPYMSGYKSFHFITFDDADANNNSKAKLRLFKNFGAYPILADKYYDKFKELAEEKLTREAFDLIEIVDKYPNPGTNESMRTNVEFYNDIFEYINPKRAKYMDGDTVTDIKGLEHNVPYFLVVGAIGKDYNTDGGELIIQIASFFVEYMRVCGNNEADLDTCWPTLCSGKPDKFNAVCPQ